MLFYTAMSNAQGAKDYFTRQLSPSDYYLRDSAQELIGRWQGFAAQLLGLKGEVSREQFFHLCDNVNPATGEQLTARTKEGRRVAYDWTFNAPKSVSVAYEVGGDDRILEAFRNSVRETMAEMEAAMKTRVRSNGADTDRQTSNMVWAEFVHRTTRPVDGVPDPQLHCHAVTFNATFDTEEDRWKAAQFGDLARDSGYYQAVFHTRLAGHLRDLGYGIERDGNSFAIAGIDRAISEKFSRRSAIIEEEAARLGIESAKTKSELGRKTREAKNAEGSITELRADWKTRLTEAERLAIAGAVAGKSTITSNAVKAMDYSLAHSFERESVVTEKKLVTQALIQSVGNASVEQVWGEAQRDGIIAREVDGQRFVTTQDVYREELAMVAYVRDGRGLHRKLGGTAIHNLDPGLSDEQREAALVILNSRDTVTELRGDAGTGKTRMMQATVKAIEEAGQKVYAFAPSAKASRGVLRNEGFSTADTVAKLLTDEATQRKVRGQVIWIDEAGLLSTRDMKAVFDLAAKEKSRVVLSGDIKQNSAVARGDALRLLEQEAGMKFAQLKQVRRQTNEAYRDAVSAISKGELRGEDGRSAVESGIAKLDQLGAVVELAGEDRYRQIATDYVAVTAERGRNGKVKTALVVSPTHVEGDHVTGEIREELKRAGRLTGKEQEFLVLKPVSLTQAQRGDAANFRSGEVVQFHQNAKGFKRGERATVTQADAQGVTIARTNGKTASLPLQEADKYQIYQTSKLKLAVGDKLRVTMNGYVAEARKGLKSDKSRLNNGDTFEVAGFTQKGDIKLTNGFVVPKDYGGLTHGYVVTSHASQGSTVDKVLIALGTESLGAADRQQFYVSVSRGREAVSIYTDDKEAMYASVKQDSVRLSASELLKDANKHETPPAPASVKSPLQQLTILQRIQMFYHAMRDRISEIGLHLGHREEFQRG